MLIDTHCHLYDEKFVDTEKVIQRAEENGVSKIICAGCDIASCEKVIELANRYESVYACIGIYPEFAGCYSDGVEEKLLQMSKNPKVVGIGEIGIDYGYISATLEHDFSYYKDIQKNVFLRQMALAKKLGLPAVIHARDCYGDAVTLLRENQDKISKGAFHCFTGSKELAKEIVKLGFYISVGGVSTFQNAKNVKAMVESVPLENIILETDSPYLSPSPMRGKINEPAYVKYVAQNLAEIKNIDVKLVEKVTTESALNLFNLGGK